MWKLIIRFSLIFHVDMSHFFSLSFQHSSLVSQNNIPSNLWNLKLFFQYYDFFQSSINALNSIKLNDQTHNKMLTEVSLAICLR